ncbi:MAG: hypothetical protein ACI4V7_09495 [Succinivibrionaceae bacterium]
MAYDVSEPLMSINKFNKPKVLQEPDSGVVRIVRLILLEPGTIQTHPDMGVGIVSKFRYSIDIDIDSLNNRIKNQIETYLPMYTTVNVDCSLDVDKKCINISIKSDQLNTYIPINIETGSVLDSMMN